MRADVQGRRSTTLVHVDAMNVTPLGWSGQKILYLVANTTDTSTYTLFHGHAKLVSILMPQVITSALLSPGGRYIAFAAPTNCVYCTFDIYDLGYLSVWVGPSGFANERDIAWSNDARAFVTLVGRKLAVIGSDSHAVQLFTVPAGLPAIWSHSMEATVSSRSVTLRDTVTGRVYRSLARAG
jgi:hypothetical protein